MAPCRLRWLVLLPLVVGAAVAERHYLFTAPKVSYAGESETMCLTLFDVPETGDLTLDFSGSGDRRTLHTQSVAGVSGGFKQTCFDVKMPDTATGRSTLHLTVAFPTQTNYSIRGERDFSIRSSPGDQPEQLFVQTDKFVYKPGQLVRFRVFSVDSELRPVTKPIPLIFIQTPLGTRVAQWTDQSGRSGLVQLEFQLSDEPTLGDWTIHVSGVTSNVHKKVFRVKEYVLPKFEVKVQGPPFILADETEVIFKVCGIYTYGKSVTGNATVHIKTPRHIYWGPLGSWRHRHEPDVVVVRHNVTGDSPCAEFRLSADELGLGGDQYPRIRRYELFAELTEAGTDVTLEATKQFKVEYDRLKLSTDSRYNKYFKPGLPFLDQIKISHPDGSPAPGELVRICFHKDEERDNSVCEEASSDYSGLVRFAIPAQSQRVNKLHIDASVPKLKSGRHNENKIQGLSYSVTGWASNSGAFLQLAKMSDVQFRCGSTADIPLLFTARLDSKLELFYQVMARGDLSPAVSVPVTFDQAVDLPASVLDGVTVIGSRSSNARPAGLVTLAVPVTPAMSTGFKVLVFAAVDGEVIADSAQYKAVPCLENTVRVSWAPDRVQPRRNTRLTVSAAPGSLCGIDVVDKSVHLLGTENRITLSSFFDRLKKLNLGRHDGPSQKDDQAYCSSKHGQLSEDHELIDDLPRLQPFGRWRPWGPRSHWTTVNVDSLTAFDDPALILFTDLVETRQCVRRQHDIVAHRFSAAFSTSLRPKTTTPSAISEAGLPGMAVASSAGTAPQPGSAEEGGQAPPEPEPSEVPETVRTYFPETWLFDLHSVSEDGTVTLNQEVPDTITEWVAGAVCTSETAGLGVSETASLTSFQPFFVAYTLPYSVKRGETLVLKVSVRNYHQDDLPVKLTLVASEEYETLSPPVETLCVPAGDSVVVPFRLRPSALGDVNITTVAEVYPEYPAACGPETVLYFSDAVTRPVLVEPEGYEREFVNSSFLCSTSGDGQQGGSVMDVSWSLSLPADLVPGSERARVEVVGDLLGPSIDNLESLVRLPTGCGEQNMVKFAPNIHVMNYLVAVGELTETLKDKLVKYMKTGYQRELTYRHDDQSYSAFGNSDSSGSMWLTAFVVKSFGEAKSFIFIDEDDLTGSVRWIEDKQTSDGCFPSVGRVLHQGMKGGVSGGGQQALTAYVTIALLRSSVTLKPDTLADAFRCLYQDSSSDIYTLTLRTHARALAGHLVEARAGLAKLKARAKYADGMLYWQNSDSEENKALSVEIGAYNILTMELLQKAGDTEYFGDALAAVRWINEQRNSGGGFVSTQDTVLALEALASFSAALPRSATSELRVRVSEPLGAEEFRITPANQLLVQTRQLDRLPARVFARAEGDGCALVQAILKYNVKETGPSNALSISVKSKPKPGQTNCLKHVVETCVRYEKPGESNMAVVEVEMVSGFIPNKGSLKALKENAELELKRWEVSKNKVVFYFDSLDSRRRCLEMVVQREQEVEDVKPARATVYDYYQAEVALSTSYNHDMDCATAAA
ncbi:pregnancy zone protein-like isoform X6 [Amphibalanus amphitrite]|uniref:pregnancy zone protein-like isoform X6 n=1 Tax=Amphibalanus amphitrite TaxID=1232801 RepID=UPI001C905169|nr:pregnancy zone protein-like isoform X6 [Amphibalanus amphitrite]